MTFLHRVGCAGGPSGGSRILLRYRKLVSIVGVYVTWYLLTFTHGLTGVSAHGR
jgi:hypothetical protein